LRSARQLTGWRVLQAYVRSMNRRRRQTPGVLIGYRGAAAALMLPQVLTFIQTEFYPEPRGALFALHGMMLALPGASGPLLGGVLIHANLAGLGWRAIFLVNVPIGMTALVLGSRRIPASAARAMAAASTRPGPRSSPWRCSPSSTR
jgi:MFS family permease